MCTGEEARLPLLPDSSAPSEQATPDIRGYAFSPAQRSPVQILGAYFYLLAVRLEPVRSRLKQPRPSGGAEVSLPLERHGRGMELKLNSQRKDLVLGIKGSEPA